MAKKQTRRQWLKTTAAGTLGASALAGCTGDGNGNGNGNGSASGTVKIGVMQPLSGDVQYYGQQSLWGFLSGLAHKHDSDPIDTSTTGTQTVEGEDVTYELVIEDSQFSPDQAQTVATDLVQDEEVDMLFGIGSSDGARRVIESVVLEANVPYMAGPAAAADLSSDSELCNELVFRASENTAMDALSGGKYVAQETDVEKVFIMAADYSFGRAVARNYRNVLESEGIEIVDERFVPRGHDEFAGLYQNAVDAGADAVIGGFTVVTLPNFLDEGLSGGYGLRMFGGFATQISTNAIGGVAQRVLGEPLTEEKIRDAKLGPFTTRYHWNQYDNDINDAFVDAYTSTYGIVPDLFTSGTFTAASAIVQAVDESGSTDGADIADALTGMTVADTPKGADAYTFQEYNNQARSEMTVAYPVPNTEDNWDAPIMPGEPLARIPADETTLPEDHPDMGCSL
ncbi:ABC transporter substrate-binding protein [Natronomonas halophila]|uniref:ABC transporter substrate-binding protein n=1 Tax=Natronomonas halophila TaxID=2747817 RepID=UPI0015B44EA3|nr:ABC transporter substrate-binding protein [Natronomonas halophila]QLD86123.1 ABC transporter substrate-binding protein [Natronomonas halophila]